MDQTRSARPSRPGGKTGNRAEKAQSPRTYSLRHRLLFFCALITIALLAVVAWVQDQTQSAVLEANESYYNMLLVHTGEIVDTNLEHYVRLASVFSGAPQVRYNMEQIASSHSFFEVGAQWVQREILRYQSKSMFRNIYVYMPDRPIINAFFYEALDETSPQMQGLLDDFASGRLGASPVYVVTAASPYQLSIVNPIYWQGKFLGMMRLDPEMDILRKLLSEVEQGDDTRLLILDGNTVIYSENPEEIMTTISGEETEGFAVSHPLHATGWRFVGTLPQASIQQAMHQFTLTFLVMVFLLMIIVALFFLFTMYSMMAPVRDMSQRLRQVGEGDFETELPESRVDEYNLFVSGFNSMVKKVKNLLEANYYQQLYLRRAQIGEMQSKFNPHFLYNTLDMIYWQLVKKEDDDTADMVIALSEILRYSINSNHEFNTLFDEQRQIENYLLLQSKRLGEGFEWEIHFDEDILHYKIPCLLLQPLVENAINHAFRDNKPYRYVGITGRRDGDRLELIVLDNGVGMTEERIEDVMSSEPEGEGSKLGVALVHRRLQYIYGDEYGIRIESTPGEGCTVFISLEASEDVEKYMRPPGISGEAEI